MAAYTYLKIFGILTYVFLVITILTGLLIFKFHVRWVKMKWHMWFGILTFIIATIHAALAVYISKL